MTNMRYVLCVVPHTRQDNVLLICRPVIVLPSHIICPFLMEVVKLVDHNKHSYGCVSVAHLLKNIFVSLESM